MSQREVVLAALKQALSGLCSGRVYRSRREQFPALPAIVIRPDADEDQGETLGYSDWNLTASIAIYATGETPDQAADSVLADVLGILKASPTLGLGSDVQVMPARRVDWAFENYDDAEVTLRIQIIYREL
ncbi:DUF3168 domain-containing protein [Dechloromonas sp. TW-R-39-2]|uniref:DUF3168 domain-containing protein n=1 Tax=Dechloromonas sp. TW-R-39-2 TaxID=2654218 RepID=UPI00193E1D1E|nr:DUF3168 domain-containing protein [Dechloromonas sp. TW-R-39-2]QRM19557.1 DUF3168 domain-containing protein [Dechloromonas sp. TW-R-39-2]